MSHALPTAFVHYILTLGNIFPRKPLPFLQDSGVDKCVLPGLGPLYWASTPGVQRGVCVRKIYKHIWKASTGGLHSTRVQEIREYGCNVTALYLNLH